MRYPNICLRLYLVLNLVTKYNFNYTYVNSEIVNSEIHNAYNLYIIKNTVTIVPMGNFTKETNNS